MIRILRTATAAAALLIAASAAQAGTTGSVNLSGSIAQSCNISVSAQSIASNLDLTTTSSSTTVANVTENCNDKLGYKVTLTTQNGDTTGTFKGASSGNNDTLNYTVTYNGAAQTFSGKNVQVTNATARTAAGGVTKALAIAFTGTASLNADTYTDTLTLTMTAN